MTNDEKVVKIIESLSEKEKKYFMGNTINDTDWRPDYRVAIYNSKTKKGGVIELTCLDTYKTPTLGEISIALTPQARGTGLSKYLFAKICKIAKKHGFMILAWNPVKENIYSVNLAKRLGFLETNRKSKNIIYMEYKL